MFWQKLCSRHDAWEGTLLWWSCQSPVAHSWGLLNHPNSFHRGMFKLNAKFDADSLLYSLSHFECNSHTVHTSLNGIYCPHWRVQWSRHCSHMHISVLSAAKFHGCHTNCSRSMNNVWTFSRQISLYSIYNLSSCLTFPTTVSQTSGTPLAIFIISEFLLAEIKSNENNWKTTNFLTLLFSISQY